MEQRSGIRVGGIFHVRNRRPVFGFRHVAKALRAHNAPQWVRDLVPRYTVWEADAKNLVLTPGLEHILDILFAGATQVNPWYLGLLAASPTPLGTWTKTQVGSADFVAYDEATLPAFVDARTDQAVSNSASKASFTISTNGSSIGGAYLASTNTKAVETGAAVILCAAAFTGGNKAADDNDTLEVTYTFSAADDGA